MCLFNRDFIWHKTFKMAMSNKSIYREKILLTFLARAEREEKGEVAAVLQQFKIKEGRMFFDRYWIELREGDLNLNIEAGNILILKVSI